MATIKLRPKQLAAIQGIQLHKQQLNNAFQELNQKESTILEIILEENQIEGEVSNVKLEGENLTFDVSEPKAAKKAKVKKAVEATA